MFSISNFQELMKGLPRSTFDQLVRKHNADKYSKHFGHWDQLIPMLYAQLSGATGMRPLVNTFNAHKAHLYHLGTEPIKRNTLADANKKRADTVFSEAVAWLMGQVSRKVRNESKELMFLLDSTSITLKGHEFERWTATTKTRNTQGIKLHVLMDSLSKAPAWHSFSAANVNDVEMARAIPLERGARYVFDKGYYDYNWWNLIDKAGAHFVTRFKKNVAIKTVEERVVPAEERDVVLNDKLVTFKTKYPGGGRVNHYHGKPLRYVTIKRPDKPTPLILATNDLTSSAATIARHYKERWAIELFFKWIKQHLKIKKFLARTENAVRIQILTALISYLLVALYKQRHDLKETLWDCLCLLSATLFRRLDAEVSSYRRRRQEAANLAKIQPTLF